MNPRAQEPTPWLLGFFCVLIPVLPTSVVLPGPLKSNGSPARMIAAVMFGLAVLGFVLVRRRSSARAVNPGVVIALLYLLLLLVVYAVGLLHVGPSVVESSKTRALITLVANVGVALYILVRVETARQRSIVLGCLATGLTFACVVGFLQATTNSDLRFLFKPPGFVLNSELLVLSKRAGAVRVVGTSEHAIEFSVLAAVTVLVTVHFALYANKPAVRWIAVFACCVALMAMPAAISRTGLVTLVPGLLLLMFAFTVRQIATAMAFVAAATVAYILTFPHIIDALWRTITGSDADPSILTRQEDYAAVSETFRDHPLFGLGLGAIPPSTYRFLDNEWLQAIVQGGLVGAGALILLVTGAVFGIAAALRRATSPKERSEAYTIGAMIVGIAISSTTFDLFSFQQATLLFFVLFGLVWSGYSVPITETTVDRSEVGRGPA